MTSARIHPSAVIGDGVELGLRVAVGPGAVLLGPLRVADDVWIGPNAVIGCPPEISSLRQNVAWDSDREYAGVQIGNSAVIREQVIITQGSHRATTIGERAWLLAASYVAHDVLVGPGATLSSGVRVGGHAVIGAGANLGLNVAVHQRRFVGGGAMVGMATTVTRDVPPFSKAYGIPIRLHGVNLHALKGREAPEETVRRLSDALAADPLSLQGLFDDPVVGKDARQWEQRVGAGAVASRSPRFGRD